jgi:large subunit ribosomal protein L21
MLAVIKTGGKQYKVKAGDFVSVEKLPCAIGESIEIKDILMTEDNGKVTLGTPIISGAIVKARVF